MCYNTQDKYVAKKRSHPCHCLLLHAGTSRQTSQSVSSGTSLVSTMPLGNSAGAALGELHCFMRFVLQGCV
jgi:hypothetical protein